MSSPSFSLYTPHPSTATSSFTPHQIAPTSPPPAPPFSFAYLPQTPSPLRTSRNANLMPHPPPTPTVPTKSSPLADISNAWTSANDENLFSSSPSLSTSTTTQKETPFSRRSRSQSPITSLNARTSAARDRRKSLFLEQIRTKREDEKFEGRGDQVLRMDWARGERERMGMLGRQAERVGVLDVDMEEEDAQDAMLDEPSPTDERELEELIRAHEEGLSTDIGGREEDMMDELDELDDEDYDRLFVEISASQEQKAQSGSPQQQVQQDPGSGSAQQDLTFASGSAGTGESSDEIMDMS